MSALSAHRADSTTCLPGPESAGALKQGQERGPGCSGRRVFAAFILFWALLAGGQAEAASARGEMEKGLERMEAEEFLPAATNFVSAAEMAAAEERDPARARFNAGNAFYHAGKWEQARAAYTRALDSEDLALQSQTYYNIGNIDLQRAESALKEEQAQETVKLYDQAVAQYEKAITLAPDSKDPKVNYEIAKKRKHELLRKVDAAESDLEKVRGMIDAHSYVKAVRFLQKRQPEHKLAFQLEPGLKKKYDELLQRTTQIAKIVMQAQKKQNGMIETEQ